MMLAVCTDLTGTYHLVFGLQRERLWNNSCLPFPLQIHIRNSSNQTVIIIIVKRKSNCIDHQYNKTGTDMNNNCSRQQEEKGKMFHVEQLTSRRRSTSCLLPNQVQSTNRDKQLNPVKEGKKPGGKSKVRQETRGKPFKVKQEMPDWTAAPRPDAPRCVDCLGGEHKSVIRPPGEAKQQRRDHFKSFSSIMNVWF